MDLRCSNGTLHGRLDANVIEVSCKNRRCGKGPGVVVIHRYDVTTGQLIDTKRFSDPMKEEANASPVKHAALRSA